MTPLQYSLKRRRKVAIAFALLAMFAFVSIGLAGCGGGSSNNNNNNNNNPATKSLLSGTVTDATGSPIIGATVVFGNQSAVSSQFGTYVIPDVVVPAGSNSILGTVTASATIAGRSWSGQNMVEVLTNEADTSDQHIILSPVNEQNAISGFVRDSSGRALKGARVFASLGLTSTAAGAKFFQNLKSIGTTTDNTGFYRLTNLPARSDYAVAASFVNYLNQTLNNVNVALPPVAETIVSFTLNQSSGSSLTIPAVSGFDVQSITGPSSPTRSAGSATGYAALRQYILSKSKFLKHRDSKSVTRKTVTRSTPSGSLIEADMFWDYDPTLTNVYGYDIDQATNITQGSANFISVATLRDPLADRFSDLDLGLTPDSKYYYSVSRLDTINFPAGGSGTTAISPASPIVAVLPLQPISQVSPASGAGVNSNNFSFSWTAVRGATSYQVLVFSRFPDLQSSTDTQNGVQTIWSDATNTAPAASTSLRYQGPVLVSGRTYYWAVLAQATSTDVAIGNAFSVSAIQQFVAQ